MAGFYVLHIVIDQWSVPNFPLCTKVQCTFRPQRVSKIQGWSIVPNHSKLMDMTVAINHHYSTTVKMQVIIIKNTLLSWQFVLVNTVQKLFWLAHSYYGESAVWQNYIKKMRSLSVEKVCALCTLYFEKWPFWGHHPGTSSTLDFTTITNGMPNRTCLNTVRKGR